MKFSVIKTYQLALTCLIHNRNTAKRCEICSKLTIKAPERRQWCRSGVFIVTFEHFSHFFSIVDFEQVNISLVSSCNIIFYNITRNQPATLSKLKSFIGVSRTKNILISKAFRLALFSFISSFQYPTMTFLHLFSSYWYGRTWIRVK